MIPAPFDYHAPRTLDEAIALLGRLGESAKILAGGQSLIPAMRFRLATPEVLVDLGRIGDLSYVEERGDYLAIGAMAREQALEASPVVAASYPLLHDTAQVIADPLVRNKATVGGNLAHADPANDHPATMLAYGAEVIARGASGTRTIPIDDLFVGLFTTSLGPGEILTEVRVPRPGKACGGAYLKVERKVGDYAVAAVAVQLEIDPPRGGQARSGAVIRHIRIGLTNVSPVPMRAQAAEAALTGREPSDDALEAAGQAAAAACDPSADLRGQVDYKRDLIRVLTKRAVRRAVERAQGGQS